MNEALQKTVDRLPEIMVKNAPSMMKRMVTAMSAELARNSQDSSASYSALLLKVGEADLVNAFESTLKDAMASLKGVAGKSTSHMPLSLELSDDTSASDEEDFTSSADMLKTLRANAKKHGVRGIGPFGKDIFLTALKDAFTRSRVDNAEIVKLMPYARRALNAELLGLYDKLNGVATTRPAAG